MPSAFITVLVERRLTNTSLKGFYRKACRSSTQLQSLYMTRRTAILRRVFARVLTISLLVLQGAILDYYLILERTSSWCFAWIVTDATSLSTWLFLMWTSQRRSQIAHTKAKDRMKIVYIAWIVYAVLFVPKVVTLFKTKVSLFDDEKPALSPNAFKMNLSITPMLFLFLIFSHHDVKSLSRRKYYLEKLTAAVALDLFDSVEMLEYLFAKEKITITLENAILAFSCLNFFLPTFALFELKFNKFYDSGEVSSISFKFIYICSFMCFVNVPFLVLRLILWHGFHLEVSVLLAKNFLAIVMGLIEIMEFFVEERPKKCVGCQKTFAKGYLKSHRGMCFHIQSPEIRLSCDGTRNANQENRINKQILEAQDFNEHIMSQRNAISPRISNIWTYV